MKKNNIFTYSIQNKFILSLLFFIILIFFRIIFYGIDFTIFYFGAEYDCIAQSLLQNGTFSDPFCMDTGPTAWMPPFLVYLIYAIYFIAGVKTSLAIAISLTIKFSFLSLTAYNLLKLLDLIKLSKYYILAIIVFSTYIVLFKYNFLNQFHDIWISMYLFSIIILLFIHYIKNKIFKIQYLIILGLLLPISSPILTFSYYSTFTVILVYMFLSKKESFAFKYLLLSGTLSVAVLLIWSYRNYMIFNKFIPVKSNLWFDFYQANVYDSDGVVSRSTFFQYLPGVENQSSKLYKELGEINFIKYHEKRSKNYLNNHLSKDFLIKVKNRLLNSVFYTSSSEDLLYININKINTSDYELLKDNHFIINNAFVLNELDNEKIKTLKNLNLIEYETVLNQWQIAKINNQKENHSFINVFKGLTLSSIPIITFLLIIIIFKKENLGYLFLIVSTSYLLPYIVISHYIRYQLPLIPLFTLGISVFLALLLKNFRMKLSQEK